VIFHATLSYRQLRYLWVSLALVACAAAVFVTQSGGTVARGDTWQGYTLGTVAALMMVWLALLGIRKRKYHSPLGSVQGWTSAHIYLGLAVVAIATLHCAGRFHDNIHTYAYVLMCAVVATGLVGVACYVSIPRLLMDNRAAESRAGMFAELFELDQQARSLSQDCDAETASVVQSSIERTVVGGGVCAQLMGLDRSLFEDPGLRSAGRSTGLRRNVNQVAVLAYVSNRLPRAYRQSEAAALQRLIVTLSRRQSVLRRIRRDVQLQGWLKIWLYAHIPLTVAALGTLFVHILTTFLDW
jgi:hypothetical protein